MLSKLKLENFKSFCSMQEIEFAPITLIFWAKFFWEKLHNTSYSWFKTIIS